MSTAKVGRLTKQTFQATRQLNVTAILSTDTRAPACTAQSGAIVVRGRSSTRFSTCDSSRCKRRCNGRAEQHLSVFGRYNATWLEQEVRQSITRSRLASCLDPLDASRHIENYNRQHFPGIMNSHAPNEADPTVSLDVRKRSTKVVRQPIFLLLFSSIVHTPFALTLRGPSGGHCVELHLGGAEND